MFSRWTSRVVAFIACVCLFVSCGSGTSTTGYLIGIDPSWYPLDLMGKEKNVYAFSNELLQEVSKKTGLKIAIVQMNWDNLLPGMQKGQCDAILSSLYPYLFNQKKYDFSDLYLMTGPVLVVPYTSKIKSLNMLKGKEIAVQAGSTDADLLETHLGIIIRTYDSIPRALNDIVDGTLDGAIVDVLIAESYCPDLYQGQLKIATPPLNDAGLRLISLHGHDPSLIRGFNDCLKEFKLSGEYKQLLKKWNLAD